MAGGLPISDLVDPLSVLNGPLLFPRAIRASVGESMPTDPGDLDSINEFMKSRALRSPEKLVIEAKRIVDSRAAILDSNLVSFAKHVNASEAVPKKGKDMPRERRPGLGLARKRVPFTLKPSLSQPVGMEPPLNLEKIQDPDEFFDAYERHEQAKKEMQKQLGSSMDNVNEFKPSTKPRVRRQGILGKSYSCRHRYSSVSFDNDMLMSSQEVVGQHVQSAPRDEPAENLITLNSNLNIDSEEIESVASTRKKDIEVNSLSDDLLSCDHEDLDGDGALNLLQERLKIKPLDLENLSIPEFHDFRRTSKFSVGESLQKPHNTSFLIDNVLKNVNWKQSTDHEHTAINLVNPVASPTPPRSPFASLSFLKKRILQSNPLRDAFSPLTVDISACQTAHPAESIDMLDEQVNETTVLRISSELESHVGVEVTDSNMDRQKAIGCSNNLPHQLTDENSNKQGEKSGSGPTEVPDFNNIEETINVEQLNDTHPVESIDMIGEQVNETTVSRISSELESHSNMDQQKAIGCSDNVSHQFIDENSSKQGEKAGCGPTEVPDFNIIEERVNIELLNDSNTSALEDEDTDASARRHNFDIKQQPKVRQTKSLRRKREAHELIRKKLRKSLADADSDTPLETEVRRSKRTKVKPLEYGKGEKNISGHLNDDQSNLTVCEDEATHAPSRDRQFDAEEQIEVHQTELQRRKRETDNERLRKLHPMRKSFAESGTSFENGVRRSKRIKMRPLEYWKGERFLYGRVNESMKLIGMKYISPGKDDAKLKVKPLILSNYSEYEDLLELAARH